MKDLEQIIKGRKTLCFFDLEATQITHEIIEIGAYKVTINPDLSIKKVGKPFREYVKAKHNVGKIVTELTGITDQKIQKEGVTFRQMQKDFIHYLGHDWEKTLFIAYGSQDGQMFLTTAENNMDASMEISRYISKRVLDFCRFLSHYVQSDKGNPLSLGHACETFKIPFSGQAHDALSDAYNLMQLYSHFLSDKAIVREHYEEILMRSGSVPYPARKIIRMLHEGKTVKPSDLDKAVEEALE